MLIAILILAALLIAALGLLFAVYYYIFYCPHRDMTENGAPLLIPDASMNEEIRRCTRSMAARECTFVTTRAADGVTLSARYYHRADNVPLCICFHGYRGSPIRDFSMMGAYLIDSGYNVLIPDQRAHFNSGSHTITFGVRERYDVLSWIEYANGRFGAETPIYLFGISMGAATVLMASGLDLPDNVRAIGADCPYNSPKDIIKYVTSYRKMNADRSWPVVWLAARLFGRFNISGASAAEAVKKTKVPILIIHGENDQFVPAEMSRQVYDANPAMVERHTFPKAGHGLSYLYDTERYRRIVSDFLRRHP